MCGIAGIFQRDGATPDQAVIRAMTTRLAHRGPDGAGVHTAAGIALGHRRLAIIDLTDRAAQPMPDATSQVWLTFNGEIYNYRELRAQLEKQGARFRTDSDSETLLHLYAAHADAPQKFLSQLRGMFAFAIWDAPRRRLLIARDRLGIKPLYFYQNKDFLAFASELDAVTTHPAVPRRLDWTSLYDYLTLLSVPGPHTIFQDIKCLPPGHFLLAQDDKLNISAYWSLADAMAAAPVITNDQRADEELAAALQEAVRLHLVADVEVGAFLSGGVDSGLVTALASEQSATPLRTFSATFPGAEVNEGHWAAEAAQTLGTKHTEFATQAGFLDSLATVVKFLDQPLATASAVSLYHIAELAQYQIKVVLTGDGGDEIFAGYNRHRPYPAPASFVRWLPDNVRPTAGQLGLAVLPSWVRQHSKTLQKVHSLATALARDEVALYLPRLYTWSPAAALNLLPRDVWPHLATERYPQQVRDLLAQCPTSDKLTRMLFVDVHTTLVDEMLTKVDRMTMAHGLEARVPLLDHHIVELAMRGPGDYKRHGEAGKLPLRRLVTAHLGPATAQRGKYGFNSPLEDWLHNDPATRAKFTALWPQVLATGAFDPAQLAAARTAFDTRQGVSATNLYTLLVFGAWATERRVRL